MTTLLVILAGGIGVLLGACGDAEDNARAEGTRLVPTPTEQSSVPVGTVIPTFGPQPTLMPTPTWDPIPDGAVLLTGTISVSGAETAEASFTALPPGYAAFLAPGGYFTSCEQYAEGVDHDGEQTFWLPDPSNLPLAEVTDDDAPIRVSVRVRPYDGPISYDQTDNVFQRTEEEFEEAEEDEMDLDPLPYIAVRGAQYADLRDDSTITATIHPDGSGSLSFTNIVNRLSRSGEAPVELISGTMNWTCGPS